MRRHSMEELQDLRARMLAEAEQCERIANGAADLMKRTDFLRLAGRFRQMAKEIHATMVAS